MTPQEFSDTFWNHYPPEVQALRSMPSQSPERVEAARLIEANKGIPMDGHIHGLGFDPYWTMTLRTAYGIVWSPCMADTPLTMAPGDAVAGASWSYDPDKPPAHFIRTSLNPADWPAWVAPEPVVHPPEVAALARPNFRSPGAIGQFAPYRGDVSPDGTLYTGPEGKFVKRVIRGPMGDYAWWELAK